MGAELFIVDHAATNSDTVTVQPETKVGAQVWWRRLSSYHPDTTMDDWLAPAHLEWSYTYNLVPIQRRALEGVTLHKGHPDARLLYTRLSVMVNAFEQWPEVFSPMTPPNGWGSFRSLWWETYAVLKWMELREPEQLEVTWAL